MDQRTKDQGQRPRCRATRRQYPFVGHRGVALDGKLVTEPAKGGMGKSMRVGGGGGGEISFHKQTTSLESGRGMGYHPGQARWTRFGMVHVNAMRVPETVLGPGKGDLLCSVPHAQPQDERAGPQSRRPAPVLLSCGVTTGAGAGGRGRGGGARCWLGTYMLYILHILHIVLRHPGRQTAVAAGESVFVRALGMGMGKSRDGMLATAGWGSLHSIPRVATKRNVMLRRQLLAERLREPAWPGLALLTYVQYKYRVRALCPSGNVASISAPR